MVRAERVKWRFLHACFNPIAFGSDYSSDVYITYSIPLLDYYREGNRQYHTCRPTHLNTLENYKNGEWI